MPAVRNLLATITIALAVWTVSAVFSAPSQAQFSDTWEFLKAVEEVDYLEMRNRIFKGANVNRKNSDGFPAIVIAAEKRNQKLIKFLLDQGVKINATTTERKETALMRRAEVGDFETLSQLLDLGADVDLRDKSGVTALMRAARNRKQRVVRRLLEAGAAVDATDFTGKSALGYARDARARRVVRLLEEAGARF
ncbi:MAG: ankyrin repeat domain-containing protein [Proteobacteria bacterium]|nr:ankyrin repeat domain-containing protein [Pseudomonadota bacterium]